MNNLDFLIAGTRRFIDDLKAMEAMILHFAAAGITVSDHTKAQLLDSIAAMVYLAEAMKSNPDAPRELITEIANCSDRVLLLVK